MDEYRVHILEVDSLDRREIARHAGTGVAPFHTRISFTGLDSDWGYPHPSRSGCSLGLRREFSVASRPCQRRRGCLGVSWGAEEHVNYVRKVSASASMPDRRITNGS